MAYVILGSDYRHIYGYTTTLEQAEDVVKKLTYTQDESIFYEELPNLDNLVIPDKLYVTVSETSANTNPKIRKFSYINESKLNPTHENFKKACECEEFRKTKLFMYQHFVIKTRKRETKKHLHERILEKYKVLFEKNLKSHLKPISSEGR